MKILVVDDVKAGQLSVVRLLEKMGYDEIKRAFFVKEALALLDDNDIDLVISDWHMMGESGLDLLKNVRSEKRTAGIAFVMLTADAERKRVQEAMEAGIDGYIVKPVSFQKLYGIINQIAQKHDLQMPIGLNDT